MRGPSLSWLSVGVSSSDGTRCVWSLRQLSCQLACCGEFVTRVWVVSLGQLLRTAVVCAGNVLLDPTCLDADGFVESVADVAAKHRERGRSLFGRAGPVRLRRPIRGPDRGSWRR